MLTNKMKDGMNNNKNVLVFPCGSEIGLEIKRAVGHSTHFNLIGANSVDDHGRFVFEDYIGDVPYDNDEEFIPAMIEIVKKQKIDAVYPTVDTAIATLKSCEKELGCIVVAPPSEACEICLSKSKTYRALQGLIPLPKTFDANENNLPFPLFAKPTIGHSGRDSKRLQNRLELDEYNADCNDFILCEYLPGDEYTIDCFTDRHGKLRFFQSRVRRRVSNGISVNTRAAEMPNVENFTMKISSALNLRGAWFFQMKKDKDGHPKLMEVAARFGGSSVLCRAQGVNLPLLSLFDAFDKDVEIIYNNYEVELDRALENLYKFNISYKSVFLDYDDCLIINGKLNPEMVSFLAKCKNENKSVALLSRHAGDLNTSLAQWGMSGFFNQVIHITDGSPKSKYIMGDAPIFIDDSFAERKEVKDALKIPVFGSDMIECLVNGKMK